MNAEQAIEILLENQSGARARMLDHATSHPEYANIHLRDCEAFELAITALREKQERENGHCNYCKDGTRKIPVTQPDGTFCNTWTNSKTNYCLSCGAKMDGNCTTIPK